MSSWKLINCPKAYQAGPVTIAKLKREEAAARAMGNHSGANVTRARWEALQVSWDALKKRHEGSRVIAPATTRDLTKIDTQGF